MVRSEYKGVVGRANGELRSDIKWKVLKVIRCEASVGAVN